MTAETAFLSSLAAYLGSASLTPAPAQVGAAEPGAANELPALVLSLEETARARPGIGERSQLITNGVLPWAAQIDLANPFLPDDTSFSLVDNSRLHLILPYGGLVKQDGSDPGAAPLDPGDITVSVAGAARTVVAANPGANEVVADGASGTLTFGAPLPPAGMVSATFFLGQWEQRLERISGTLRLDVCAGAGADALSLSDAALDALLVPAAQSQVQRLLALTPIGVSSIGAAEQPLNLRRRTLRLTFGFEREVNRPDSSGGIIRRVEVDSALLDGGTPPGVVPESGETFLLPA